jgi:cytochrome c553
MKTVRIMLLTMTVLGLMSFVAYAAGDAGKGKALFNDPKAFGGDKSCSACHPDGKDLEKAGGKKEFKIMGKTQKNLEEAVNMCIVNAGKGKAIDPKSEKMTDLVAYIKSLGQKKEKNKAPDY